MAEQLDLDSAATLLQAGAHDGLEAWQAGLDRVIGADPSPGRLAIISRVASQPGIFRPLIDNALKDPDVIEQAYRCVGQGEPPHPQVVADFIHIPLAHKGGVPMAGRAWDVSLHVWPFGPESCLERPETAWYGGDIVCVDFIHSHSRFIGSTILSGSFSDIIYAEVKNGGTAVQAFTGLDPARVQKPRVTRLAEVGRRTIEAGKTHTVSPDLIHEVTIPQRQNGTVATLVVRGPQKSDKAICYSGNGDNFYGLVPVGIDAEKALALVRRSYNAA